MKDGKKLLAELGELRPRQVYFRTHNLLTSGDGTPAPEVGLHRRLPRRRQGKPDLRLDDPRPHLRHLPGARRAALRPDRLHARGPLHQAGAVPAPLEAGRRYEEIYTGWAYPPKDYEKWAELVFQWTKHCVERYGRAEVETLVLGDLERAEHRLLARHARGVPQAARLRHRRRAARPAHGQGRRPDTAGGRPFLRDFLEHCLRGTNYATGQTGTPLDFVAFHAKGAPRFVDGHVQMGIANQLRDIDPRFAHRRLVSRS